MPPPIYALVLAGGRSTRMQKDKAALTYHGRTQLEWAVSLLQPFAQRVFVSVRPDQTGDPVRARFEQIVDTHENLGPIAGITAAQAKYPDVAWLVLACDLPFLDSSTLAPASINPFAIALPIPDAAPVTTAPLPLKMSMFISSSNSSLARFNPSKTQAAADRCDC